MECVKWLIANRIREEMKPDWQSGEEQYLFTKH